MDARTIRLRELEAQHFEAIEGAIDWAKENRKEILTGTMIFISGVAFLAFGGPGILILAPAAAVLLVNEIGTAPPDALNQEGL